MKQMELNAIVLIASGMLSMITIVTIIWKSFSFIKKLEDKADRESIQKVLEDMSRIRFDMENINREMHTKVGTIDFQLLIKDIEILKKDMVTKTDFEEFRKDIIHLLSDNLRKQKQTKDNERT